MNELEKQIFEDADKSGLEEKINRLLKELNEFNDKDKKMTLTRYVLADTTMRAIVEHVQENCTPDDVRKQVSTSSVLLDVIKSITLFLVLCKKFGLATEVSNDNKKD